MFRRKLMTLLSLIIVIQFFALIYVQRFTIQGWAGKTFTRENAKGLWHEVKAQFKSTELPDIEDVERIPLPKYKLTLAPSDWRRLNQGITQSSKRIQVPVTLEVDEQSYEGRVRISGGAGRHWKGDRKSLRLRFAPDRLYKGIREINVNIPETHRVIIDPLAWQFAQRMGLPVPENGFVRLEINGLPQGLRIYYEDIDQFWLERNGLMGYIFTEDDGLFPFHYQSENDADYPHLKVINKKGSTLTEVRNLTRVLAYPSIDLAETGLRKLMDIPQILTWHAHALLCGSGHQNVHNIQLYFNSSLQKFQAIPWDIAGFDHWGHLGRETWAMDLDWCTNRLIFRMNQVPEFVQQRNQILYETITQTLPESDQMAMAEQLVKTVRYYLYADELKQASQNRFSNQDFENAVVEMKQWIGKRNAFIKSEIEKADLRVTAGPTASGKDLLLSLGTGKQSGVTVASVEIPIQAHVDAGKIVLLQDINGNGTADDADLKLPVQIKKQGRQIVIQTALKLLPARQVIHDPFFDYVDKGYMLQTRPAHQYYQYIVKYKGAQSRAVLGSDVKVHCQNSVTGQEVTPSYFETDPLYDFGMVHRRGGVTLQEPSTRKAEINHEPLLPLIEKSRQDTMVTIPRGNYTLSQVWTIPEWQVVTLTAGTQLKAAPGASIYVRGVLNMPGTQKEPILLENEKAGQPWGALIYHETTRNSRLDHVIIRYASMAKIDQINFTGAVSAYHATIMMNDCIFDRIQADDGINIKYSESRLLRCQFLMARDDALDYDFSNGEIRNCYFYRSGGDAIDCGTANPHVVGNYVQSPGDKCLSVGENSAPVVEDNFFIGGQYGIAVKDDSKPLIQNNTVCQNKIGLSFYIKKPDEFGCPSGTIERCLFWDNKKPWENLCDAQFDLSKSLMQGGFDGHKMMSDPPQFDPEASSKGLRYILKENSLYAKKGWGAPGGFWQ